mmetsp:Transcript_132145/g.382039  ORF Transcript_132145/g.382039 Transcript_132145/m.382039 type:complete len:307 (-) Transcript_132145:215-1135(-)
MGEAVVAAQLQRGRLASQVREGVGHRRSAAKRHNDRARLVVRGDEVPRREKLPGVVLKGEDLDPSVHAGARQGRCALATAPLLRGLGPLHAAQRETVDQAGEPRGAEGAGGEAQPSLIVHRQFDDAGPAGARRRRPHAGRRLLRGAPSRGCCQQLLHRGFAGDRQGELREQRAQSEHRLAGLVAQGPAYKLSFLRARCFEKAARGLQRPAGDGVRHILACDGRLVRQADGPVHSVQGRRDGRGPAATAAGGRGAIDYGRRAADACCGDAEPEVGRGLRYAEAKRRALLPEVHDIARDSQVRRRQRP